MKTIAAIYSSIRFILLKICCLCIGFANDRKHLMLTEILCKYPTQRNTKKLIFFSFVIYLAQLTSCMTFIANNTRQNGRAYLLRSFVRTVPRNATTPRIFSAKSSPFSLYVNDWYNLQITAAAESPLQTICSIMYSFPDMQSKSWMSSRSSEAANNNNKRKTLKTLFANFRS